jgi:hypothetical protein
MLPQKLYLDFDLLAQMKDSEQLRQVCQRRFY